MPQVLGNGSLVICKGKKGLIKGVPRMTLFLRFFTNRKGVSILTLWFSIAVVYKL